MQQIGQAATAALELMDSPQPSATSLVAKPVIRLPTTMEECRALREWADSQVAIFEPVTTEKLAAQLEFMDATLPRRNTDDEGGKKRAAVYAAILGRFSEEAIRYMARRVCETMDWFPTPHQCLQILEGIKADPGDRGKALRYCQTFLQQRLEAFLAGLAAGDISQDQVDAVPEQWRLIAVEKGYLRRLDDGSFIIRKPVQMDDGTV